MLRAVQHETGFLNQYAYDLPDELIAQAPSDRRDQSRLLVLGDSQMEHLRFADFPEVLVRTVGEGALLVVNDTKVVNARIFGKRAGRAGNPGGKVELLVCEAIQPTASEEGELWRCLYRASKPLRPGDRVVLDEGPELPPVMVVENEGGGKILARFYVPSGLLPALERLGKVPLPPYIRKGVGQGEDQERYQTIYAKSPGAVAAPTAGLHFTKEGLDALLQRGIRLASVTLHVGPGTFAPVKVERLADHVMHRERYEVPASTAQAIAETRARGGKVVAVGTTVVRTLESAWDESTGCPRASVGETGIFIYPPYRFRAVDALLTNFHLPCSTLLMLVSALAGRKRILSAYREAVCERYRFFSYGDAMFLPRIYEEDLP